MVNIFFSIIAFVIALVVGVIVLFKDTKKKENRIFFLFSLMLSMMFFARVMLESSESGAAALTWARVYSLFLLFVPAVFLHLTTVFPKQRFRKLTDEYLKLIFYVPTLVFVFFIGDFLTNVMYAGAFMPSFGFSQKFFVVYFLIYWFLGTRNFIKSINEPDTEIKKMQFSHAVIGIEMFLLMLWLTDVLLPGFGIYPLSLGSFFCIVLNTFIIYSIWRYYLFVREPVAEEYRERGEQKYPIVPNSSICIADKDFKESFRIFLDQVLHGKQGICITRENPKRIQDIYPLKRTPIVWLTELNVKDAVNPSNIEEIGYVIDRFTGTASESVVFLDGIEYLSSFNSFTKTLHLIQDLRDKVSMRNSNLLVPIKSAAFDTKEFRLLEKELDKL